MNQYLVLYLVTTSMKPKQKGYTTSKLHMNVIPITNEVHLARTKN